MRALRPKAGYMTGKFKVVGLLALGAVAGALTTTQLQAFARGATAPLPIEELQQLAAEISFFSSTAST